MKRMKLAVSALAAALLLSGCLYAHVKLPYDKNLDKTVLGPKTGHATMHSVFWLIAWGDASTEAAAKEGGITTISHMDQELTNIVFGIYTESTTIVYGE